MAQALKAVGAEVTRPTSRTALSRFDGVLTSCRTKIEADSMPSSPTALAAGDGIHRGGAAAYREARFARSAAADD
jgi:hypothetical protein